MRTKILPPLGAFLIRLLGATLRIDIQDPQGAMNPSRKGSYLFAFWHNRISITPYIYAKAMAPKPLVVMISTSKDGQLITSIAERFGIQAARGSSSKTTKGIQAFLKLVRELKTKQGHVAITPDGPRGPRYEIHPGIIHLSQASGVPIIPMSFHFSKKWELNSWDKFQIPKPFCKCTIICHNPISIPKDIDQPKLTKLTQQLKDSLR